MGFLDSRRAHWLHLRGIRLLAAAAPVVALSACTAGGDDAIGIDCNGGSQ